MAYRPTFETWMIQVDRALVRRIGLESSDLPDWDYWTAWEDGLTPSQVVRDFMESEGYR